jgi:hypothetical protein
MTKKITIPDIKSPSRLFWVGLTLAALWIGMNLAFPQLAPTGILSIITRLIIEGFILTGLWLGLSRTAFTYRTRVTLWLAVTILLTFWFILIYSLATRGVFLVIPGATRPLPLMPLAIFVPVLVGLTVLTRSGHVASLLDVMPASWLIGLQLYRVLGGFFLVNWLQGNSPGIFALPAGIGDVTVGVLALPAAALVASGTKGGHKAGIRWNILGIMDLSIAIVLGVMTSPGGPLYVVNPGHAYMQVGTFPEVMTPAFSVPVSIILHGLSIWQLKRRAQRANLFHVGTLQQLGI